MPNVHGDTAMACDRQPFTYIWHSGVTKRFRQTDGGSQGAQTFNWLLSSTALQRVFPLGAMVALVVAPLLTFAAIMAFLVMAVGAFGGGLAWGAMIAAPLAGEWVGMGLSLVNISVHACSPAGHTDGRQNSPAGRQGRGVVVGSHGRPVCFDICT
jgi:hypothetical protein